MRRGNHSESIERTGRVRRVLSAALLAGLLVGWPGAAIAQTSGKQTKTAPPVRELPQPSLDQIKASEGDTAMAIRGKPGQDGGRLRISRLGTFSGDEENVNNESDPIFQPKVVSLEWDGNVPHTTTAVPISLSRHPQAQAIMQEVVNEVKDKQINVALLGQRKYMVNNCLGLKTSVGEFDMRLSNPTFGFEDNSAVLRFKIDKISMSALKVRMRPSVNFNPCTFSGRFEVGGSASDVTLEYRFDPKIDMETCRVAYKWFPRVVIRIGNLNLKPLQNDLDKVAKNMIEDAMSWSLEALPDQTGMSAAAASIINGITRAIERKLRVDCPGGQLPEPVRDTVELASLHATAADPQAPGGTGADVAGLEQRVAQIEQRLAVLESQAAGDAPAPARQPPQAAQDEPAAGPAEGAVAAPGRTQVAEAYAVEPNPELRGRLGRIIVQFPAEASGTRIEVYSAREPDKQIHGTYGKLEADLMPGTYVVSVAGKKVEGVPIESRSDTKLRVGVLHVDAGAGTRVEVLDENDRQLVGDYGSIDVGLPVGTVKVRIAGQDEPVEIREGEVTNF